MEIEVKNFYPVERIDAKGLLKGGLHVAIKWVDDIELNIRGILASRQNEKWFFRMPFKNGTCHKTGNTVTYPILSFTNQELNKALLNAIYEKAPIFISNWLELNPQATTEQKQPNQPDPPTEHQECEKIDPIAKKATSTEIKSTSSIKKIVEWKDPPARKPIAKKQYSTTTRR